MLPAGAKPTGALRDEAVKILPMHSARGLQFRIVVVLWADLLPSPFKGREDSIDRGLFYVALTRAEDMLAILHSGSSPYVEELFNALGRAQGSSPRSLAISASIPVMSHEITSRRSPPSPACSALLSERWM